MRRPIQVEETSWTKVGLRKKHTEAAERTPLWIGEPIGNRETGSEEGRKGWQVLDIEGNKFMKLRNLEFILQI